MLMTFITIGMILKLGLTERVKFMKKILFILLCFFVMAVFVSCSGETPITSSADTSQTTAETIAAITTQDPSAVRYDEAFTLIAQGENEAAYEIFKALGDYRDAKEQLAYFRYVPTRVVTRNTILGYIMQEDILYNDKNLPVMQTNTLGSSSTVYEYIYDDNSILTEFKYQNNYSDVSVIYLYDENNRVSKVTTSYDGEMLSYEEYTYDENGNRIRRVTDGSDYRYDYNENGQVTKYYSVGKDGKECIISEYIYDASGNLVEEISMINGSLATAIVYAYDKNGVLIRKTYDIGTEAEESIDYVYNENGKILQKVITSVAGSVKLLDYLYDTDGNLIGSAATIDLYVDIETEGIVSETVSIENQFVYFPHTVPDVIQSIITPDHYIGIPDSYILH